MVGVVRKQRAFGVEGGRDLFVQDSRFEMGKCPFPGVCGGRLDSFCVVLGLAPFDLLCIEVLAEAIDGGRFAVPGAS